MTRNELEQAFWTILRDYHATVPKAVPCIDALLSAADRYAVDLTGKELATLANQVAAQRQAELAAAAAKERGKDGQWAPMIWHWQKPGSDEPRAVCHGRITAAPVTRFRERVTCGTCKQSRSWRAA